MDAKEVNLKKTEIQLEKQLNSIENMLKLLLLDDVIDKLDDVIVKNGTEGSSDEIADFLLKCGVQFLKKERFGDNTAIYIELKQRTRIHDIRAVKEKIQSTYLNVIPVFVFQKINGMQKKKMEEEKISYYVIDKELHITG